MNLLKKSEINPKLSAESQLNGNFDYNITPLAPAGTAVVAHKKPRQRGSCSVHGSRRWYLGPDPNHYRCFEVYMKNTGQTRIVDTIGFYPAKYKMPTLSTRAITVNATVELTEALQNMTDTTKIKSNKNELKEI